MLSLASDTTVGMEALLGCALESALEVSGGEAGALFLFEPAEPERCTVAWAARGQTELPRRQLARQLMEAGAPRLAQLSRAGRTVRVHRDDRNPDEPTLVGASREALWVPLLDRGRLAAVQGRRNEAGDIELYREVALVRSGADAGTIVAVERETGASGGRARREARMSRLAVASHPRLRPVADFRRFSVAPCCTTGAVALEPAPQVTDARPPGGTRACR